MTTTTRRPKRSDISDEEALAAIRDYWTNPLAHRPPTDVLADRYPPKVVEAKWQHLANRGLIDYGVSLRTAWVVADH